MRYVHAWSNEVSGLAHPRSRIEAAKWMDKAERLDHERTSLLRQLASAGELQSWLVSGLVYHIWLEVRAATPHSSPLSTRRVSILFRTLAV